MGITISGDEVSMLSDKDLDSWLSVFGARRPRKDTLQVWRGILRAFDANGTPQTVRQLFYALSVAHLAAKTEAGYRKVQYQLLRMRRLEIIPYSFIADNTRWMRKPNTYDSLASFLDQSQRFYRRSVWSEQDAYVEIWIEKDALAGVVAKITMEWDVPLMVTRGYPSESFLYEAAQNIENKDKPAYLYYFGDYDPSGVSISENTAEKLAEMAPGTQFERVAVNRDQITRYNLPSRPTKRTDTRAKDWIGESVELDALPANLLQEMVGECILRHIDRNTLDRIQQVEEAEKETLAEVAQYLPLAA